MFDRLSPVLYAAKTRLWRHLSVLIRKSKVFTITVRFYVFVRVRVTTMTHFCTFGTVTPVLIIGFGWFFSLIDRSRSQAALMQVSSTLLNSESRKGVKCENIFCVSWWQIMSHDDTHLKSIENSEATLTQPAKNFQTKRFYTSDRNATL